MEIIVWVGKLIDGLCEISCWFTFTELLSVPQVHAQLEIDKA